MRRRLAATSLLAVAPFLAYGRQAYAACLPSSGTIFICSGTSAGEDFTGANAVDEGDFRTAAQPPFVVTTDGVAIEGNAHIQFHDYNASSITNNNYNGDGLVVRSTGNDGGTDGAVTIVTNGTITGDNSGIYTRNDGDGDMNVTVDGDVTGHTNSGIIAFNSSHGDNLTITTGTQSDLHGGAFGIYANNDGGGDFEITADGIAAGDTLDGIHATNSGADLTITTGVKSDVRGGQYGIWADNEGSGDLDIIGNNIIKGYSYDGIRALNQGHDLTVTTAAGSSVYGLLRGIYAYNEGTGDLIVTANGAVTGEQFDGITAENTASGGNMTITTGAGSEISGGDDGIQANNSGHGNLAITVNGSVTGESAFGISAINIYEETYNPYTHQTDHAYGVDLTITTGAGSRVYGEVSGIRAQNDGIGDLAITIDGEVTGGENYGVYGVNSGKDLTVTTGAASTVRGKDFGIFVEQYGTGALDLTINGRVTGEEKDGINAYDSKGEKLTVTVGAQSVITGALDGIYIDHRGHGDAEITVGGVVVGTAGDGIDANNDASSSDNLKGLKITTTAGSSVTGGVYGIYAENAGDHDLIITVDGLVRGETKIGISTLSDGLGDTIIHVGAHGVVEGAISAIDTLVGFDGAGRATIITNDGIVRNLSGETNDLAINAQGGPVQINNNASLIGTVTTGDFGDTLDNAGVWRVAGGNADFGGSDDELNNQGTLVAARDPSGAGEVTIINNLETFNNNGGLVTLADGKEGDELQLNGPVTYTGNGGRLGVDAFLAPAGASDVLTIDGTSAGHTTVIVNLTNAIGSAPNTDGIPVVFVSGETHQGDFDVEHGVLNAGFFAWNMRLAEDGHTHELFTSGLGAGAYEFAAGITGAQDLWHQTTGTILQRQADLRPLLEGAGVTPVADFSEPVTPSPVTKVTPGFWFRGLGSYSERDNEENGVTLDRKQTIWGGLAGFDFGTQDVGDALMFGVFGGYIASDLDFDRTDTKWQYEGPTIGVYATYLDHALHLDATLKADFLDIDIDASDLAPGAGKADTNAFNIGGQVDAGYKIGLGRGLFVDPQASLAVLHTEIDNVDDIFGGAVEFDDATSVRGRLGLRLGHETTTHDGTIYSGDVTASVWEEFAGNNDARIFAPLTPANDVSDDPGETYGDVSLGFSILGIDGWSGFLRGNYLFADDYDAIAGNAGVRYSW